jgi:hypothetical protein
MIGPSWLKIRRHTGMMEKAATPAGTSISEHNGSKDGSKEPAFSRF